MLIQKTKYKLVVQQKRDSIDRKQKREWKNYNGHVKSAQQKGNWKQKGMYFSKFLHCFSSACCFQSNVYK